MTDEQTTPTPDTTQEGTTPVGDTGATETGITGSEGTTPTPEAIAGGTVTSATVASEDTTKLQGGPIEADTVTTGKLTVTEPAPAPASIIAPNSKPVTDKDGNPFIVALGHLSIHALLDDVKKLLEGRYDNAPVKPSAKIKHAHMRHVDGKDEFCEHEDDGSYPVTVLSV